MEWIKLYMKIYICVFFIALFVIPSIRIYKETGINPVTFGNKDNVHDYIGFVMKLIMIVLAMVILFSGFIGEKDRYFLPVWFMEEKWILYTGLVLIHLAFFWILIAQYQMRRSWRIGIDEKNKTELVTHGIFSISRNPIFLGMIVSVFGIFMILPSAITFTITVLTYFIIQIQIRMEETFLEKQHGEAYLQYKKRVRRFI